MTRTEDKNFPHLRQRYALVSLQPRKNLSPFTKDFRGEGHYMSL